MWHEMKSTTLRHVMLNAGYEGNAVPITTRPLPKGRDAIRLLLTGLLRVTHEPSAQRSLALPAHWLVLALVIERPSYAYELGTRYERHFASFAPTAPNAVYKSLDRLCDHNLVTSAPEMHAQGRRSIRVVYKATQAGVEAHRHWLLSEIRPRHWREELLARIATGTTLRRGELLTLVDLYEHMTADHSQQIDKPPSTTDEQADSLSALIRQLVAQEQDAINSAQLAWVEQAKDQIRRLPA